MDTSCNRSENTFNALNIYFSGCYDACGVSYFIILYFRYNVYNFGDLSKTAEILTYVNIISRDSCVGGGLPMGFEIFE